MRFKIPGRFSRLLVDPTAFQKLVFPGLKSRPPAKKPSARKRPAAARLTEVTGFGINRGNLRMLEYAPPGVTGPMPLVVVLHGCLQTAADFDRGSGWTSLARKHGFAVLYPEQKGTNNANLCFNWFRPSLVARDRGELGSIREMIDFASKRGRIDPDRIFVIGLSAGGAMASALLATYPDVFAAGAIVAGLPFGAARDAMSALSVMKTAARKSPEEWAALVRGVSPDATKFPAVSVWHGKADRVVSFGNAEASLSQWLELHGLPVESETSTAVEGGRLRRWQDHSGKTLVDMVVLDDLGHGMPVKPASTARTSAAKGDSFMLPSGIPAAESLVKSWNLDKG